MSSQPKISKSPKSKNSKEQELIDSITETYQKKTQLEHILQRPETYTGSDKPQRIVQYVAENKGTVLDGTMKIKLEERNVRVIPALLKVVSELCDNARDQTVRHLEKHKKVKHPTDEIRFWLTPDYFSIQNNGDGIPIVEHPEHKIYIPELVLGHLLTGSNFNDTEERISGGRNGYGAKLANIWSTRFIVETADANTKKLYIQVFSNNMTEIGTPVITNHTGAPYTKITMYPDFEKFKLKQFTKDHQDVIFRRAIDIAGTPVLTGKKKLKVYFNDESIPVNSFKSYVDLHFPSVEKKIYVELNDRWKVAVLPIPNCGHKAISFVNSINTYSGGTHVDYVVDQIVDGISKNIKKKHKEIKRLSHNLVKEHLTIMIDTLIVNPTFSSQTKEKLTSRIEDFGSECNIDDKVMTKIINTGICDIIVEQLKLRQLTDLEEKKTKKTNNISNCPKLEDARDAGSDKSFTTSLILTEGDSAKGLAMGGLAVVGQQKYGVFPLKGKLLNVRDCSLKSLTENEEIKNIIKIIGLRYKGEYSNPELMKTLRYGRIIIFTDQDDDGFHIKGLLMNFFHFYAPELIKHHSFIQCLQTPIVKVKKSTGGGQHVDFYSLPRFEDWKKEISETGDLNKWKIKYYKGLGTSTPKEAREYFTGIEDKLIRYNWDRDDDAVEQNSITLAFQKDRADDRKDWLRSTDIKNQSTIDDMKDVSYTTFVNKELILFSNSDNIRSLPMIYDGLKPSQRKVLFGAKKRGLDKETDEVEVKVSQLAGHVSDVSSYHHGEMSLTGTIVGMAQDFVGANNINMLIPSGQFGTRQVGGKDAASPRYTFTRINPAINKIYRREDEMVLSWQTDDGQPIEPSTYYPIIPMILVNGSEGIGTGFSTTIPQYNPLEVIESTIHKLEKGSFLEIKPWFRGFSGTVEQVENHHYRTKGVWAIDENTRTITITELPVGQWTIPYKEFLDKLIDSKKLTNYSSQNTDVSVHFILYCSIDSFKLWANDSLKLESDLKLTKNFRTSNIHMYKLENQTSDSGETVTTATIEKYDSVQDIALEHYNHRLIKYGERKCLQLRIFAHSIALLENKIRFIKEIVNRTINLDEMMDIISFETKLETEKYDMMAHQPDLRLSTFQSFKKIEKPSYDYLTSMKIRGFTKDKIAKLEQELADINLENDTYSLMTLTELWTNELIEARGVIQSYYKDWFVEFDKQSISSAVVSGTTKKKTAKKSGKMTNLKTNA